MRIRQALMLLSLMSCGAWLNTAHSATLLTHLTVAVQLHDTVKEVTKACQYKVDGKVKRVFGCWKKKQGPNGTLHAMTPRNWCENNVIHTLGHEVMHVLGWSHGPQYKSPYFVASGPNPFGCRHGEFWTGLQNPRP
jgi:hypothetical protein